MKGHLEVIELVVGSPNHLQTAIESKLEKKDKLIAVCYVGKSAVNKSSLLFWVTIEREFIVKADEGEDESDDTPPALIAHPLTHSGICDVDRLTGTWKRSFEKGETAQICLNCSEVFGQRGLMRHR